MERHILQKFFKPQAVALVGASPKEGSIGYTLVNNLKRDGFQGDIYPINPKHGEILGLKAYPSVTAVGAAIDLAVIAVPILGVPAIMQECGQTKVPAAIIISAGGKEVGDEGQKVEAEIAAAAKAGDIRYLGPNCLGIIAPMPISMPVSRHARPNPGAWRSYPKAGPFAALSWTGPTPRISVSAILSAWVPWRILISPR